jgi:Fe2+ or Zn2+ uptake regulation protein
MYSNETLKITIDALRNKKGTKRLRTIAIYKVYVQASHPIAQEIYRKVRLKYPTINLTMVY